MTGQPGGVGRRRTLRMLGVAAAVGLSGLAGGAATARRDVPLWRWRGTALGARAELAVAHPDPDIARRLVGLALAEVERLEGVFSLYRPDSAVVRLNTRQQVDRPPLELVELLTRAHGWSRSTDGAFDVTVQPLWALLSRHFSRPGADPAGPSRREVARAVELVGYRGLEVAPGRVRLARPGMAVTLNGIAQGFAADRVVKTLQSHGVANALVDTGEMSSLGVRQDGDAWTVGLQHPRQREAYISLTQLSGRCLATSGDYATTFSPDFTHHHIFDPHTGASPAALAGVWVLAATAMDADALSTAVFVLGRQDGVRLLRETPGADAFLVLKDGRTWKTPGFATTSRWDGAA